MQARIVQFVEYGFMAAMGTTFSVLKPAFMICLSEGPPRLLGGLFFEVALGLICVVPGADTFTDTKAGEDAVMGDRADENELVAISVS
jgi:hypothetical protein